MPDDSLIPGRATERVALNGAVLPSVKSGGPSLTVSSNPTISLPGFCALPVFVLNWLPYEANAA